MSPGASLGTVPVFGFSGGLGDARAVPTFFTANYYMHIVFLLLLGTQNTSRKWVRADQLPSMHSSVPFHC